MSDEIKVGDKVRVREDAPRLYTDGWSCNWLDCDVYVTKIDGDAAEVKKICDDDEWYYLNIPLKYLVKVEEEKKEAKFKVGDKVIFIPTGKVKVVSRINANSLYTVTVTEPNGQSPLCVRETELAPYIEHNAPKFKIGDRVRVKGCGYEPNLHKGDVGEVLDTNDKEQCFVLFKKSQAWIYADCLEPFTEPTEEVNLQDATREFVETHPFDIESLKRGRKAFEDMYWDAYTADLAKEIALKVANKYNGPEQAAEYAVSVAKAVVGGLKRK